MVDLKSLIADAGITISINRCPVWYNTSSKPLPIIDKSPKRFLVIPHDLLDALDDFTFSFKVVYQNYVCLSRNWSLSEEKTGMLSNMLKL